MKMPWKIVSKNNVMRFDENHDSIPAVANSEIISKRDEKRVGGGEWESKTLPFGI